ncbi:hypothetical protein B0G77_3505 [Paraburkholderia sp. BL10I2N1]|nr:hypothetical protein B0G77_3505 [Paraburkholderia sp. BL10I2N1]
MDTMQQARLDAAAAVNAEDASIWRWFCVLLEERRVRWRYAFDQWVVSVDRVRVAAESNFHDAIRAAKRAAENRGLGLLHEASGDVRRSRVNEDVTRCLRSDDECLRSPVGHTH